jgi:DNA-directed RNA polymerase I subunit RPA12
MSTLTFCDRCGTLFPPATSIPSETMQNYPCAVCNKHTDLTAASKATVTTRSHDNAFPSALRARRSAVQTLKEGDVQTEATITQTCPECGRTEMKFYTMQLRSADEGATVFYRCECGYRYVMIGLNRIVGAWGINVGADTIQITEGSYGVCKYLYTYLEWI